MKIRLSPLFALFALAACVACTKRPVQPGFAIQSVDSLLHGEGFDCRIEYRFASIGNAAGHPALETIERANIGYFYDLEAFEGTAAEAAEAAIAQIAEQYAMPPGASGPDVGTGRPAWEGEISVESEGNVVDSLLCYAITRSSYTGGAHGMYSTQYHIYSLADGFELSLADLFDARQLEILDRAIREKIAETYDAVSDEDLSDRGFFPEYICPTENFRITPEGIAFFYNPYEIGCYALGSVEVTFTWAELDARFAAQ
ncbi:MAG TPA: DUF3298 domain-containing protein [Candidatus Alistipes intestinipullorum]|nr:DUF3298 domain-containing protein [Candidatus Alistipes intestinipullorum]